MTLLGREDLRRELLATIDRGLFSPPDEVGDKAILVALRAAAVQTVANDFLDVAIEELARRR